MLALSGLGYRLCVPVVEAPRLPLAFRTWTPGAATERGAFGIEVPVEGAPAEPDLLLVPMLAFDARGHRLGYGGGFYDRTIAGASGAAAAGGARVRLCGAGAAGGAGRGDRHAARRDRHRGRDFAARVRGGGFGRAGSGMAGFAHAQVIHEACTTYAPTGKVRIERRRVMAAGERPDCIAHWSAVGGEPTTAAIAATTSS